MAPRQKNSRPLASPGMAGFLIPNFSISLVADPVTEDAAQGTHIGDFSYTPVDAVLTMVDSDGNKFQLNGNALEAGHVPFVYDTDGPYQNVHVRVSVGGYSYDQIFPVTVEPESLTEIDLSATTMVENVASGTVVGALTSVPAGASFTLTNNAGGRFAISGSNLVAGATASSYDQSQTQSVTVEATRDGDTLDHTFNISITAAPITVVALAGGKTLVEGAASGTVIGALSSTPSGAAMSIVPANAKFAISGGNLVAGTTATAYDTAQTEPVTVRATHGAQTKDQAFNITITAKPITAIALSGAHELAVDSPNATVGTLSATPNETGTTFSLVPANAKFAISGTSLKTSATPPQFSDGASVDVTVRATHGAQTHDQTLTITLDGFSYNIDNADVAADSAEDTLVGNLSVTPAHSGTITYEIDLTNTTPDIFKVTGSTLVIGSSPTGAGVIPCYLNIYADGVQIGNARQNITFA